MLVGSIAAGRESEPGPSAKNTSFPEPLETYLRQNIRMTATQLSALRSGQAVTKLIPTDTKNEVAIFGAIWIEAPPSQYIALLKDIEQFERGTGFLETKRISTPPRLSDFDALELDNKDLSALKACKVGKCDVKLSQNGLQRIRSGVDWSRPTANADALRVIRSLFFEYVQAYQAGGNERLVVYRDSDRPTHIAEEFTGMINAMSPLMAYLPDLQRHLLEYPKFTTPGSSDFFYWQIVNFGLKPTVRINHVIIENSPAGIVVASKQLYASHYFQTAIELRVLVTDPSRRNGFYFVNVNRSRVDGLTGFLGSLIRGRVRSKSQQGLERALRSTKLLVEMKAVPN